MDERKLSSIKKIIIHCSDSAFGDAKTIDAWHKERGWEGIGYHYVILNGYRNKNVFLESDAGLVEIGRPLHFVGSHTYGANKDSIGICLIGERLFHFNQFIGLKELIDALLSSYNLDIQNIYGHYNFNKDKTCPNFNVETFVKEFYSDKLI